VAVVIISAPIQAWGCFAFEDLARGILDLANACLLLTMQVSLLFRAPSIRPWHRRHAMDTRLESIPFLREDGSRFCRIRAARKGGENGQHLIANTRPEVLPWTDCHMGDGSGPAEGNERGGALATLERPVFFSRVRELLRHWTKYRSGGWYVCLLSVLMTLRRRS
jgi:hypothetical protein